MEKLTFRLILFSNLFLSIFLIFEIFSIVILSKNQQNIDILSLILSIILAIFVTWIIDMIDDLYDRIIDLEYEIERQKSKQ
jgi:c-di-AMP phosphodiesterase-like protein